MLLVGKTADTEEDEEEEDEECRRRLPGSVLVAFYRQDSPGPFVGII